ncbi:MAG TPA: hypothetical protein VFF68_10095 [Anaerolineaceae bacterium]|nr:hypothetical protein [Anaerolineaceae bacterium]
MKRNTKHGDAPAGRYTKLYWVYAAIKQRCMNPNNKRFKDYGGRGITLYPEWANDYASFREYINKVLGPKPSPVHSLDRIDNDKGYEPGNLRWATPSTQNKNTRRRNSNVVPAQSSQALL